MNSYSTFIFDSVPPIKEVPEEILENFNWEEEHFSRPKTSVRFFAVKNQGFYAFMRSFEQPILKRYTKRDEPIWTDSCMEVFLSPVKGRSEYINIEMNSNGAYLSQFGKGREERVFVKELTDEHPVVKAQIDDENGSWQIALFIPESLISELYKIDYHVEEGEIRGNFYKCADDSPSPHFLSLFPVGSVKLGFHNPETFGNIILNER